MNPSLVALGLSAESPMTAGGGAVGHYDHGPTGLASAINDLIDRIAPCPWVGHSGGLPFNLDLDTSVALAVRPRLYTPDERLRRDASPWTLVQGILAPLQFLALAVSVIFVVRYLTTGQGYALATGSILVKTALLYTIMITGCIWEKEVFGKWLFAHAFFWEDVFSMLVLGLQTTYVCALFGGWGTPRQQMFIAISAYAAYAINATQFLLKLRAARMEGAAEATRAAKTAGRAA